MGGNHSDIVIRYVTPEDKDDWVNLWKQYQTFYEVELAKDVEETTFSRFLDSNVKMWSALALDTSNGNRKVVGMVNFLSHLNTWKIDEVIYINDLFVVPDTRSNGIGRKLINFVYDEADKMGTPSVYWRTDHFNHRAQLLYTKIGELTSKVVYSRPE